MSRSYKKKLRVGIAGGTNTEFYRSRTRKFRRSNNAHLKKVFRTVIPEEIDENLCFKKYSKKDSWLEPTDGSHLIDDNYIKQHYDKGELSHDSYIKKYAAKLRRQLKSIHINKIKK